MARIGHSSSAAALRYQHVIVVCRYFLEAPPCVEDGLTDLGFTLCEPVGAIRA
jgi:hypothetical protein